MKRKLIIVAAISAAIMCLPSGLFANGRNILPIIPKDKLDEMVKHLPQSKNKLERLGRIKKVEDSYSAQLKLLRMSGQMLEVLQVNDAGYYGYTEIKVGNSRIFLIFNSEQDANEFMNILYSDLDIASAERLKNANSRMCNWLKQQIVQPGKRDLEKNNNYFIKVNNIDWLKNSYFNYCREQGLPRRWPLNPDLQEKLRMLVEYKINFPGGLAQNLLIFSKKEKGCFSLNLVGISGQGKEIKYFLEIKTKREKGTIVYQLDSYGRLAAVDIKKEEGGNKENFINDVYEIFKRATEKR